MPSLIDVHTHIFTDKAFGSYMEKVHFTVERAVTIQYWVTRAPPRYTIEQLLKFAWNKPISVIAAMNMYYSVNEQLRRLTDVKNDIAGVKGFCGYQYLYPSDESVYPFAEFCTEHDLPLMFHSGDTSARGNPLLKFAHPLHIDELATRYPKCKIIIAHFGFPYFMDTAMLLAKHANVYTDISGVIDNQSTPERLARLIKRYQADIQRAIDYFPDIVDKILFGTDYSGEHTHLTQVQPYLDVAEGLFAGVERQAVLVANARRVFKFL